MRQTFEETADPSFGARHLPLIRGQMAKAGLDAFVIPHEDEHQNEYLPEANERLAWATGFTGSAGAAVVTTDAAAVFVDGRYTLQVAAQVDPALFEVRDLVAGGVPAYLETLPNNAVVGYDPRLHSPDALARLQAAADRAGAELRPVETNPVDAAWTGRPPQPQAPVAPHPAQMSGEDSTEKRARVAAQMAREGADAALITAPSSIAWLFNIRGGDVKRSPLPLAQAILRDDGSARLFLDPAKETEELRAWLGNAVTLEAPDALSAALQALAGKRVLVDAAQSSAFYFEALRAAGASVLSGTDPCVLPRAAKNAVEIEGARRAHRRDAVPMARLLHWLSTEGQTSPPDEIETVTQLERYREDTGALKDISFDTIAGAGPNGAIVHYRPTTASNRRARSRATSCWWTPAASTWTARPTSPARSPSASRRLSSATASPACCRATSPSPPPASRSERPGRRSIRSRGRPCGGPGWITSTAPATAWAAILACTKARSASPRPRR